MSRFLVALVGRPNVGKSTVFNRLVGQKIAIIDNQPGITRDRIYGQVNYLDFRFALIDTGGITIDDKDFDQEIMIQTKIAIEEADIIIFIIDGKEGLTADDFAIRDMLFKSDKQVIVAINKIDHQQFKTNIYDFYELGFNDYFQISAEHGRGFSTLLDKIITYLKESPTLIQNDNVIRFSVLGRPNVGKSSLVNALLNEERVIVSTKPGTTRDAIDTHFKYHNQPYIIIDTAGIRKKSKIDEKIEYYSLLKALKAISRSHLCLLVLNAEEGIMTQDKHIARFIIEEGKSLILVVNKWDKAKDKLKSEFIKDIKEHFRFIAYALIIFLSALTKKGLINLMPKLKIVYENTNKQIKTSILNDLIQDAISLNPPPSHKGKRLKIYFVNQKGTHPPKFLFQVNNKSLLHFSYYRYLENKIRESIDFEGTPIILQFKNRGEK